MGRFKDQRTDCSGTIRQSEPKIRSLPGKMCTHSLPHILTQSKSDFTKTKQSADANQTVFKALFHGTEGRGPSDKQEHHTKGL